MHIGRNSLGDSDQFTVNVSAAPRFHPSTVPATKTLPVPLSGSLRKLSACHPAAFSRSISCMKEEIDGTFAA